MKYNVPLIEKVIFSNKQNISWNDVEQYLKRYIGQDFIVEELSEGWYRYDTYFGMTVQGSGESEKRVNLYRATLVVRKTPQGLFLYDVINIKKEASTPHESKMTVR